MNGNFREQQLSNYMLTHNGEENNNAEKGKVNNHTQYMCHLFPLQFFRDCALELGCVEGDW